MSDTLETPDAAPQIDAEPQTDTAPADPTTETATDDSETFPRSVVEELRRENAKHRTRAKQADDYAKQLFHERVNATGRLASAEELPYHEDLLDADAMNAAIDNLLTTKPYLAARRPVPGTTVGQGIQGEAPKQTANLIGALRSAHGWS